jgi:carbamoyl-phosphate synthase small subunit
MKTAEKAYLVLSDGAVFEGRRFGAPSDSLGELVFTTGMCGYVETLTDPSYGGQIIMQTFPLIGNYGIIEEDFEGGCAARGYVVREACDTPSNFRCGGTLDEFLKKNGVPGICGVDTRELTRIIREHGVMNAKICSAPPENTDEIRAYAVKGEVARLSCKAAYTVQAAGKKKFSVVLVDYGAKRSIARELSARGCEVTVTPQNTPAEDILAMDPDGIMLSNGPGDPQENVFCIEQIKKLAGKKPIFGICLGHQLTALAMGGETYKLKYGHRGVNQPVREINGTRTYITSQNHGYAVKSGSLGGVGRVIFENANDGTCEGVEYPGLDCFTVQFHPEAHSGPADTAFLFDRFTAMMEGKSHAKG